MKVLYLVIFLFLLGCKDNLTLNQLVYNNDVKYKVMIEGHIKNPGLYLIDEKTYFSNLIMLAGGYKKNANKINDYLIEKDHMVFVNSNRIKDKINLNRCNTNELIKIKGIGIKKALSIIEYRKKYGDFKSISELKLIKGIKNKLFNNIYEYFYI